MSTWTSTKKNYSFQTCLPQTKQCRRILSLFAVFVWMLLNHLLTSRAPLSFNVYWGSERITVQLWDPETSPWTWRKPDNAPSNPSFTYMPIPTRHRHRYVSIPLPKDPESDESSAFILPAKPSWPLPHNREEELLRRTAQKKRRQVARIQHILGLVDGEMEGGGRVAALEGFLGGGASGSFRGAVVAESWEELVEASRKAGAVMWERVRERRGGKVGGEEGRRRGDGTKSVLFVGILSSPLHVRRRQACRETWLKDEMVGNGSVEYRFFVGMHRNDSVSNALFEENQEFGDLEILPIMDSYFSISFKTLSLAQFASQKLQVKYVMKTDDDAFVRLGAVLDSILSTNHSAGMLYGNLEVGGTVNRNKDSKWFVNLEEWPLQLYPKWAHGAGYIFTVDIATFITKEFEKGNLKVFKLEDIFVGILVDMMANQGANVSYVHDDSFVYGRCKNGYKLAHYQVPAQMMCLWQNLETGLGPKCCSLHNKMSFNVETSSYADNTIVMV